jgi:hypothetical protein
LRKWESPKRVHGLRHFIACGWINIDVAEDNADAMVFVKSRIVTRRWRRGRMEDAKKIAGEFDQIKFKSCLNQV